MKTGSPEASRERVGRVWDLARAIVEVYAGSLVLRRRPVKVRVFRFALKREAAAKATREAAAMHDAAASAAENGAVQARAAQAAAVHAATSGSTAFAAMSAFFGRQAATLAPALTGKASSKPQRRYTFVVVRRDGTRVGIGERRKQEP